MFQQITGNRIDTNTMNKLIVIMIIIASILFFYITISSFKTLKNEVTKSLEFIYFIKHSILLVLISLGIFLLKLLIIGSPGGDAGVAYGVTLIIFTPILILLFVVYVYTSYFYNKAKQKFISDYKTEPVNIFPITTKFIITIFITLGGIGIFLNI
ncbi:hypothetical protein GW891_02655 [bacterium]|nr:hypothetical protein [bacterium]